MTVIPLRMTPRRLALLHRLPLHREAFLYYDDRQELRVLVNCGYATQSDSGDYQITTDGRNAEKEWARKLERVLA